MQNWPPYQYDPYAQYSPVRFIPVPQGQEELAFKMMKHFEKKKAKKDKEEEEKKKKEKEKSTPKPPTFSLPVMLLVSVVGGLPIVAGWLLVIQASLEVIKNIIK